MTQASAALIAIVGGLLVSRYVSLHAEQQAAQRRVSDLERREREAESHLMEADTNLKQYFVDEMLDDPDVYQAVVDAQYSPTVREVLEAADNDGDNLDQDILTSRLADLGAELRRAILALRSLVPEGKVHDDYVTFKRNHDFEVRDRGAWEWAYDKSCELQRDKAKAEEAKARRDSLLGNLTAGYDPDLLRDIALRSPVATSPWDVAQVESMRRRLEEARSEVRAIQQERRLATETFEATRQPEGFNLALQVLSLLAVLGMALPVTIMGFVPLQLPGWARAGVIAGFFIGVSVLLRFLFVYAGFLREGGRDNLPRSI